MKNLKFNSASIPNINSKNSTIGIYKKKIIKERKETCQMFSLNKVNSKRWWITSRNTTETN